MSPKATRRFGAFLLILAVPLGLLATLLSYGLHMTDSPDQKQVIVTAISVAVAVAFALHGAHCFGRIATKPRRRQVKGVKPAKEDKNLKPGEESLEDIKRDLEERKNAVARN